MQQFSEINYDKTKQTVTLGAGLIWDDVYAALEPHGVNVLGGRVTGLGVAGFILGGGEYASVWPVSRGNSFKPLVKQGILGRLTNTV